MVRMFCPFFLPPTEMDISNQNNPSGNPITHNTKIITAFSLENRFSLSLYAICIPLIVSYSQKIDFSAMNKRAQGTQDK